MLAFGGPILVGVNGTRHSRGALLWVLEHTQAESPCAVTAWQRVVDSRGSAHDMREEALLAQSHDVDEIARLCPRAPAPLRLLVHGAPGPALVDVSKNAGLLVLGTGGVQPEGPGVGSTAFYCLSHALCPVLVVPALEYLLLARQEPYAEARPPEVALTH